MNCEECGKKMDVEVKEVNIDRAQDLSVIIRFRIAYSCPSRHYFVDTNKYQALQLEE